MDQPHFILHLEQSRLRIELVLGSFHHGSDDDWRWRHHCQQLPCSFQDVPERLHRCVSPLVLFLQSFLGFSGVDSCCSSSNRPAASGPCCSRRWVALPPRYSSYFINSCVQCAIGTRTAIIYGRFSVSALVFVRFVLPETMDRSLKELNEMLQQKVTTCKLGQYVFTGLGAQIRQLELAITDSHAEASILRICTNNPTRDNARNAGPPISHRRYRIIYMPAAHSKFHDVDQLPTGRCLTSVFGVSNMRIGSR